MGLNDYSNAINYMNNHSDFLNTVLKDMVYKTDLPDNLAPSFHNISTMLPFIICCRKDKDEKHHYGMLFSNLVIVILIMLATLFVRQHYFVDIIVAFVICEVSYLIA
jgi:hypothetical protein